MISGKSVRSRRLAKGWGLAAAIVATVAVLAATVGSMPIFAFITWTGID